MQTVQCEASFYSMKHIYRLVTVPELAALTIQTTEK